MDRGKVTEELLNEHAARLAETLNRILFYLEVAENDQIASGARRDQLNLQARNHYLINGAGGSSSSTPDP
jgi:hypothetical protein